jgi:hypothetical protein
MPAATPHNLTVLLCEVLDLAEKKFDSKMVSRRNARKLPPPQAHRTALYRTVPHPQRVNLHPHLIRYPILPHKPQLSDPKNYLEPPSP